MTDTSDALETPAAEQETPKLNLDVKVEEPSACERHVTVTISREDVDRYFSEAVDELKPKAEVPGFRPGRAPRKLLETRFKEQVTEQIKGKLVTDSMTQATEDLKFSAISEPDFNYEVVTVPEEGPMVFEFNIEVRPEFELPKWEGLTLEKPVREVTDADIDERIAEIIDRLGSTTVVDGPAKAKDIVTVNAEFTHNGELLSILSEEPIRIRPTVSFADGELEGFDKLMVGAAAGDTRSAKVKMAESAEKEELQGQEVDVEFEVLHVERQDAESLDSETMMAMGGFSSTEEVREAVRKEQTQQTLYHQRRRIRDQIAELLTESANWELPPDLLRRQSRREYERAIMELQSSGFSPQEVKQYSNKLRQNAMENTSRSLKEHFILERIAEEHQIDASPEDYELEIMQIALQQKQSPRSVRVQLERRGLMDTLRNQIVERKVLSMIEEKATVKEVPLDTKPQDVEAVDFTICGEEEVIPEATQAEAGELPKQADHT